MCRQTRIVSDLCIRCHLSRAFTPCPFLGGGYKCSPNSPLSIFCIDKPALQITHVVGFTVFDEGPDTGLKKTGKLSVAGPKKNRQASRRRRPPQPQAACRCDRQCPASQPYDRHHLLHPTTAVVT